MRDVEASVCGLQEEMEEKSPFALLAATPSHHSLARAWKIILIFANMNIHEFHG
jgi:hypothetical protein